MRPIFNNAQNTSVTFEQPNGPICSMPWNPTTNAPADPDGYVASLFKQALSANGMTVPDAYVAPPAPPATCQLWQLQAVMTAAQWSAAQQAVQNLNNLAVSAFFAHGTNVIPANSATLLKLGEAIGLTADQVAALVQQASQVSIP